MKLIDKILQSRFFLTLISILISFAFGALFLLQRALQRKFS